MSGRRIRWGVLSTANIGRLAVIPAIQNSRNGQLVAVASRDPQRARDFAANLGIPKSYGSYGEILSAEDVDAVYIPLPNSMHTEWTVKAAEEGKHVLCEKPLAMNAAQCEKMDAAARRNGVKLMEAFMYRFHPQTRKVLGLLRDRILGEVKLIHSAFTFRVTNEDNIRLQPELGGGALMDVGCYCVNISRTIVGQEPFEVQAYANWGATGVDEQLVGTLRFPNGILGQFDSALTLSRRECYQIVGTDGVLEVPVAFLPGMNPTTIRHLQGRNQTQIHVGGDDEYRLMVEHFADCILNDEPVRYTVREATANMRVIEALYCSARNNGQPASV